jgi:hypothetical protein
MSINELELPVAKLPAGLKYRLLGTLGMFGAPMLFLQVAVRILLGEPEKMNALFQGTTGILYIGGWIAVAVAMRGLRATGSNLTSRIVFIIQMFALATAFILSVQELLGFDSSNGGLFYNLTDIAYPLSHVLMLVVGVLVWRARVFKGLARIAPFGVALILPLFFIIGAVFGMPVGALVSSGFVAAALFVNARAVVRVSQR